MEQTELKMLVMEVIHVNKNLYFYKTYYKIIYLNFYILFIILFVFNHILLKKDESSLREINLFFSLLSR